MATVFGDPLRPPDERMTAGAAGVASPLDLDGVGFDRAVVRLFLLLP